MARLSDIGGNSDLFVGEDKIFRLEVIDQFDNPVNIAGWGIQFDIRRKDNSTVPAIFSKTGSIVGVFNAARNLNTQRVVAVLTDTELNTLRPKTYRHSWKRTDDGSETILAYGDFTLQEATQHE